MLPEIDLAVPRVLRVAHVVAFYMRHCKTSGVHCPEARAERVRTFVLFCHARPPLDRRQIGQLPVGECRAYHLSDFIDSHKGYRSSSTRRAKANMVRAAFQWAVDAERIDRNPFRSVKYAEAERRPELPDETLQAVATAANKQFEQVLRFLRLTWARLSELCAALPEHIDWEQAVWKIPKHKSRRYTQKSKEIALVPEAVAVLRSIPMMPGVPIFRNTRGKPWNRRTLGQQLRRMKIRHHIAEPATLHGIRHRGITEALANGGAIKLVAEQAGHSSTAVTERFYWHRSDEHTERIRAAAQLGAPKNGHAGNGNGQP